MKYKNSFFRVEIKDDGTYLNLYPALNGGKTLELKEIFSFLESKGCFNFMKDVVKMTFDKLADRPVQIRISETVIPAFDESAVVNITPDNMIAAIRFYPPSTGGKFMTKKDIIGELNRCNITHGIQENIIDVYLTARQYCLNIPIAKGKKPTPAKDTQIEYKFDTKPLAKPKLLEDGSVDFHELNIFTKVTKGQILAVLTPHEQGEPGYDIFGNSIEPNKPKISVLKYGKKITLSEDKCSIVSDVNGSVSLTNDTVFVSDTYDVPADVDVSTGNINYEGNVVVAGNVRTGFTVKATGDIQVNGVVEGATLIAGGNIVIKRGMQGINKGELDAGGDICANFFESSTVRAAGDVIVGSILHSHVEAGKKVVVSGRKGFIIGGEVSCGNYVEAKSIGNRMETQTIIKVGVFDELYEEMKGLMAEVVEFDKEIEENTSYLNVFKDKLKMGAKLSPENLKAIKQYTARVEELKYDKQEKYIRLNEIRSIVDEGKKGSIKVMGDTYRGVSIYIASSTYIVKDTEKHGLYKIVNGGIESVAF